MPPIADQSRAAGDQRRGDMISTKRIANLAVAIVDKLSELGLAPTEKQEVIFLAGQLALIEGARAKQEVADRRPDPDLSRPHPGSPEAQRARIEDEVA